MSKRGIAGILCLCMLGMLLCSCNLLSKPLSDEEMIENRIDRFLRSYNTGDLEGVLSCMDAKTRKAFQSAINIGQGIAGMLGAGGISLSDLFGLSVGMSENDELLGVEIYSIKIENESADVIVKMTYAYNGGATHEENALFEMLKEDDDWFIRDFRSYYGSIENN